jgi:hypothetical protein
VYHRAPLMVLAFSVAMLACGDEDDSYSKKDMSDGSGRPRSSTGSGKPRTAVDDETDEDNDTNGDAGPDADPNELDGGADEPNELDGASSSSGDNGGSDGGSSDGATTADAGGTRDGDSDARADAQPTSSDGGEVACASPGEDCETLDCCAGATCILEPETGDPICAAECSAPTECNSGCCLSLRNSDVGACGPARYCEAPPVPMGNGCDALVLIAEDGTFLGNAVSSPVAANGVCNDLSPHGSSVGPQSIFNSVGIYGSTVSPQSAYNRITPTPPALMCAESREIVAFVTKNTIVAGRHGSIQTRSASCSRTTDSSPRRLSSIVGLSRARADRVPSQAGREQGALDEKAGPTIAEAEARVVVRHGRWRERDGQ